MAKRTVAKALAAVAAASTAEPTAQPDPASITLPAWVVRMLCGTALICGRDMTAAEHDALREATQLALRAA